MIKAKKGYTMIEVLIVVLIIATLAAMIIPRYSGQSERGVVAEATAMLATLREAEVAYNLENSAYTSFVGSLDMDTPSSSRFDYSVNTTGTPAGTATATRSSAASVDENYRSKTIILDIAGTWSGDHPYTPNN